LGVSRVTRALWRDLGRDTGGDANADVVHVSRRSTRPLNSQLQTSTISAVSFVVWVVMWQGGIGPYMECRKPRIHAVFLHLSALEAFCKPPDLRHYFRKNTSKTSKLKTAWWWKQSRANAYLLNTCGIRRFR
jgi:hypothetical protein